MIKKQLPRTPQPKEWQAKELSQQYIAAYKPFTFVDGEGVRCSLYVSGCRFACPGCYNVAAQNFHYGTPFTSALLEQLLVDLDHDYVQGLTFLGGEPFLNTQVCLTVAHAIRKKFGNRKDIWSFSGYSFEELQRETPDKLELLRLLDVLIDGRFLLDQRDLTLQFRGSANQRVLDAPASCRAGRAVIWPRLQH